MVSFSKFLKWLCRTKKEREVLLWNHETPAQIDTPVNVSGRIGKVVEANYITVTVEWDD